MERTLVLIKPDGVQRGLIGRILQRFEDAGLKIAGLKMVWVDEKFASDHYFDVAERRGQKVFKANVDFMIEGPVLALALDGVEAIATVRKMVGDTEPKSALPGTIRGDFSHQSYEWTNQTASTKAIRNLIHASSSSDDAKKELALWFKGSELHGYQTVHEKHTF